ncbi:MAG: glycyl-radical enzyme activating protein [Deltaproteobacteria bacterium]|nr:glycyl-radical enzyme activating protein [Deltaproteobacteria bacterium]
MEEKVLVTDIARFSVNDGPGFRTNVFLKGCPLHCGWCHNPETIDISPEIFWKRRLCVQCGACFDACPRQAVNPPISPEHLQEQASDYFKIIPGRCDRCMKCVEACRYDALQITGKPMSISEILDEVEKDRLFYDNSGGGMTLSGGEPTVHAHFSEELLRQSHERLIHTCLDTNGHCMWEVLEGIAKHTDIILFDLKHLDPQKHYELTGVRNDLILANLEKLCSFPVEVWVRIPVIPGFNDGIDYHKLAAEYLLGLPGPIGRIDLLPYHNWCQDKYGWLGIDWVYREVEAMDPGLLEVYAQIYREKGFTATVGGSGFEEMKKTGRMNKR